MQYICSIPCLKLKDWLKMLLSPNPRGHTTSSCRFSQYLFSALSATCQSPRRWPGISINVLTQIFWLSENPHKQGPDNPIERQEGREGHSQESRPKISSKKVKQSISLQISPLPKKSFSAFRYLLEKADVANPVRFFLFSGLGIVVRSLGKIIIQLRKGWQPRCYQAKQPIQLVAFCHASLPPRSPWSKPSKNKTRPNKNLKLEHIQILNPEI